MWMACREKMGESGWDELHECEALGGAGRTADHAMSMLARIGAGSGCSPATAALVLQPIE